MIAAGVAHVITGVASCGPVIPFHVAALSKREVDRIYRATGANEKRIGTNLSVFTWGIVPKIRAVDDAITPGCQLWAYEVHPEVSFWALAERKAMAHKKKSKVGFKERLDLLQGKFPDIERHLANRPHGVGKDDLLDAAVAAWTALRLQSGVAEKVCEPEPDAEGLAVTIWY